MNSSRGGLIRARSWLLRMYYRVRHLVRSKDFFLLPILGGKGSLLFVWTLEPVACMSVLLCPFEF